MAPMVREVVYGNASLIYESYDNGKTWEWVGIHYFWEAI